MIKKIKKLKNIGIFSDFQWDSSTLSDFGKFNLFYGWNGSGKTTLTKLFSCLEKGASPEFPSLEYELETDSGTFSNGQSLVDKVRVFNQSYIENNIEITGSKAKPIFILGEENKAIAAQVEKDEEQLKDFRDKRRKQEELKDKKELEKGKKFTDVAKIIGANTSGSTIRNYRKPDAEKVFALLNKKELLSEPQINTHLLTLKQEEKNKVRNLDIPEQIKNFPDTIQSVQKICLETVGSVIIERLKKNSDISKWVESGLDLHKIHKSDKCEFCNQTLPDDRLKELASYFNEEDKKLKNLLEELITEVNEVLSSAEDLVPPDKANFYVEFQSEYVSRVATFNKEKINLKKICTDVIELLEEKKVKTTESIKTDLATDNNFKKSIEQLNLSINLHNEKSDNFQTQRDSAQSSLEKHYLSEIFDDVKNIEGEINDCISEIKRLDNGDDKFTGINQLIQRINDNKSKISSEHKACDLLNKKLETFLGRKEISFETVPGSGYLIKRNGQIAKNLSEGEQTAIAFVYFIVHLEDQNFGVKDGIIIIDDPVSSLDSNCLFQAFSFLKNSVEDAGQVFLFTHNYDFLRLLINWLNYFRDSSRYYMVSNKIVNNNRVAEIRPLDTLLTKHESEYHYLCKILFEFETDGTIASVYNIPNIARKVLETFLMFRVPNGEKAYKKLERLQFDKNKKTSIYKFTNDQSHITGRGFDPSLVPESQKNVTYLLEMMKEVFPEHYQILTDSISS